MRLQTRLGLAAVAIIGVTSFAISYSALIISTNSDLARLNSAINLVVDGANQTPDDPVTPATELGELSAVPITIAVVVDGSDLTILNESRVKLTEVPSLALLRSALAAPISVRDGESYQMRSIQLSEDQFVIVATSLAGVDRNASENGIRYALITLASVMAGGLLVVWLIRREMRVVEQLVSAADEISRGGTNFLIVGSGTSELSQLGESLNRMVQTLNHSVEVERGTQQRLQRFLGDASHELRTPLTVVRGYTELLAESDDLSPEQRERALERIRAEIARMEQLIRDLLLLTELGSAPTMELKGFNLSSAVEDAVSDIRVLQPARAVQCDIEPAVTFNGSEPMIRQLLANAMGNIARHTPSDAAVRVQLTQGADEVHLTIEDAGPGLGDEGYQRGIQEFSRFDPSRSRESGGSGLGMSIMAAIARRHGGQIELSPSSLGGLKLEISLPLEGKA